MRLPLFLRAFNSPFKRPKIKFYIGKVAVGVPYFFPRKWVKYTRVDAIERATESLNDERLIKKSFKEWYEYYKNYSKAVPKKIGFDFCDLMWKTKYDSYRFEYSPVWSFVAFGYQIAIRFIAEEPDHYWESFLYYFYDTDKSKSAKERVKQCRKEAPQTWSRHNGDHKETIDYYQVILKDKWKNKY